MTQSVERVMPRVHSGKGDTRRRAEREAMLADQVRGMRMTAIAAKYDVSLATVSRRLKAALDERMPATVEARREQLNASLDERMAAWEKHYQAGAGMAQRGELENDLNKMKMGADMMAQALAGQDRVDERRARLNGADAPVKVEAEVVQITPQEKELRDLLAAAEQAERERESTLVEEEPA